MHLDLDVVLHRLPGVAEERLLQPAQPALRGPHQILHWGRAGAHGGQQRVGRDATVHNPDPLGLPVLLLDHLQKPRQRRVFRRVAPQHFIRQREAFGGDNERNDHLHAVGPFIPAVPMPA